MKMSSISWKFMEDDGMVHSITLSEILDSRKYEIKRIFDTLTQKERVKSEQKKQARKVQREMEEKELIRIARIKRREHDTNIMSKILLTTKEHFENGRTTESFSLECWEQLVHQIREPFKCEIDDSCVSIAEGSAAVMLKNSAMEKIANTLFKKHKESPENEISTSTTNKKKQCNKGGNTVGATGHHAQVQSKHCNEREKENMLEKKKRELQTNKKEIEMALTCLEKRKQKISRQKEQEQQEVAATGAIANTNNVGSEGVQMRVLEYYEIDSEHPELSTHKDIQCLLWLFLPNLSVLSKTHLVQWDIMQSKVLPVPNKHAVNAKKLEFESKIQNIDQQLLHLNYLN